MNKINMNKFLNYAFFLLTYALFSYTDAKYVSRGINNSIMINLKYVTMVVGIIFALIQIFFQQSRSGKLVFHYQTKKVFIVIFCFCFLSLFFQLFSGRSNNMIEELIKLILPIIYAFCILNIFKFKDIYNCMVGVLFFSVWGYIIEIGINNFTISNIKLISYSTSYSPFESHYAAGVSIALCAFFMFYNQNKFYKYISLLFALCTFKRLAVIFSIIFFIIPNLVKVNKKVSHRLSLLIKCFFIFATVFYYNILTPEFAETFERIFKISTTSFTMGRSIYIEKLIYGNYSSWGLGSSSIFIGKSIEMDFIKIMIEISILGLIIFIWNYWDICRDNLYCMIYMFFVFINLLTSHSLTNVFNWTLTYIIIGTILYKNDRDTSNREKNKLTI